MNIPNEMSQVFSSMQYYQMLLAFVPREEFMNEGGSVVDVIDYAEGNVQDKKSRGTDTLAPLLRKIGHL